MYAGITGFRHICVNVKLKILNRSVQTCRIVDVAKPVFFVNRQRRCFSLKKCYEVSFHIDLNHFQFKIFCYVFPKEDVNLRPSVHNFFSAFVIS